MASSLINDGQCVMTIRAVGTVVPESLQAYMRDRIARLARLGWSFTHVAVEAEYERNPRLADTAHRVQVTCRNPSIVVRAEFADATTAAAFDACLDRLHARLRRLADKERDRRRGRYGHATGDALARAGGDVASITVKAKPEVGGTADSNEPFADSQRQVPYGESALVVRRKVHPWRPMSVDDAIEAMELLGHSFYLFIDSESAEPCVVYQRRAFTYGLVKLGEEVKSSKTKRAVEIEFASTEPVAA